MWKNKEMRFTLRRTNCYTEKNIKIYYKAKWDNKREEWYIDIKSLDELINFVDELECHQIVFSTYPSLKDRPEIEIYDDYRE